MRKGGADLEECTMQAARVYLDNVGSINEVSQATNLTGLYQGHLPLSLK